ncbi:hypothetical protein SELMODRAFT_116892 [Selaginella moellendorffii]|uniref:Pentacotripeptide-repeat region of PRORP domain-containing protein n=1 Tax=Selaginella moellendorffii TaxID=88036 RepID=D8SGV4_SELML|nr:hypothetical protein SELMODRAFT_116892 [Selaginella moellendorffii]
MLLEGLKPRDSFVFTALLGSCAQVGDCRTGSWIHSSFLTGRFFRDVVVGTALINMYGKCGAVRDAFIVFQHMEHKNSFSRNAMIDAFCRSGAVREGLDLFRGMQLEGVRPDSITFTVVTWNVILSAYAQRGHIKEYVVSARRVFDDNLEKDRVSWNALIAAYARNGHGTLAFQMYRLMNLEAYRPNLVTFVCVLRACTCIEEGRTIHRHVAESKLVSDTMVGTALVTMYGSCGSLNDAVAIFESLIVKNEITWTSILVVSAQHHHHHDVLELYSAMVLDGIDPNHVTFVALLFSCCHHGLPSEALSFYRSMTPDHGIEPNLFHLACVFDTLAREGFITDVIKDYLDLSSKRLRDCSKECNDVLWTSLLSGCTIHGDKYNAKQAARSALRSNAKNSAAYSFVCANL